jgi:hypothetical protein
VRLIELAGTGAEPPERLDQLAGLVELEDSRVRSGRRRVAFRDEDVAVRCDEYVVRLVEVVGLAGAAALAERQQQLAVGTELEDLMALCRSWRRRRPPLPAAAAAARRLFAATTRGLCGASAVAAAPACGRRRVILPIGQPHVPLAIDEDAVRKDQHPLAETLHELSRGIEFQHRRQIRHLP